MTKAKGFLVLGGALCLLFGVWLVVMPIMSETHGTPYCGNSKYSKFSFKNGQEFLIPDAYLDNRYGINFGPGNHNGVVGLVVVEMHRDDGRPNCEKIRNSKAGFVRISITDHNFETVLNTHKGHYPYRIEKQEDMFDLHRSVNSKVMKDLKGTKDFLIPKQEAWKQILFIELTRSVLSASPGEKKGAYVRRKIKDRVLISYGYDHKHLSQYQQIDTTIKNIILSFIIKPEGK